MDLIFPNDANFTHSLFLKIVFFIWLLSVSYGANVPHQIDGELDVSVNVVCNKDDIVLNINSDHSQYFQGMVFPKGLANSPMCLKKWIHNSMPLTYNLPLRGCNTMSNDLENGHEIEYFNTIIVEPHLKLVTNQGKGFHIRCRYNTSQEAHDNTLNWKPTTVFNPENNNEVMPICTMRIVNGNTENGQLAEAVTIGDPLTLVIAIDNTEHQTKYGIRVTDCLVRDGLGSGEQKLVDENGCPIDSEIMGHFKYTDDDSKAIVHFQAHKFPYTTSVYYHCNVQLCQLKDRQRREFGCKDPVPQCKSTSALDPSSTNGNVVKMKRQIEASVVPGNPATIEVYRGLYVNEANNLKDDTETLVYKDNLNDESICVSQQMFAIGICIAGVILMVCAIIAIIFLVSRTRHKKTDNSNLSSSIYSGPYTNTVYSHNS